MRETEGGSGGPQVPGSPPPPPPGVPAGGSSGSGPGVGVAVGWGAGAVGMLATWGSGGCDEGSLVPPPPHATVSSNAISADASALARAHRSAVDLQLAA